MTIQAKVLKEALKKIKANNNWRISVRTEIEKGGYGKAWAVVEPLTEDQEKTLQLLLHDGAEILGKEYKLWVVRY